MARKIPLRDPLGWRQQVRGIRAASRRGASVADIAKTSGLPTASVQKILSPGTHPRLSDPNDLLRTGNVRADQGPAEIQLYWVGFITAAGYIRGEGRSLTLILTLGENGRGSVAALKDDLMMENVHCEWCHSSMAGWQAYFRDASLCQALLSWGIPSDLYGDDPALLETLPEILFAPFIRGYVEGGEQAHPLTRQPETGVTIQGTWDVLAALNTLIQRYWGIGDGSIREAGTDAVLDFSGRGTSDAFKRRLTEPLGSAFDRRS